MTGPRAAGEVGAGGPNPSIDIGPAVGSLEEYGLLAFAHRGGDGLVGFFDGATTATTRGGVAHGLGILGFFVAVISGLLNDYGRRGVEILAVGANLAGGGSLGGREHIDAHIALARTFGGEGAVGDGLDVAGDDIGVCAVEDAGEGGVTADGHQGIRVGVGIDIAALEGDAARAALGGVLTLAQGGYSSADEVESLDVECQGVRQRCCHIAGGIGVCGKVGDIDRAFDIPAEVGATGVLEGFDSALVNDSAGTELDFGAVVEAGDAAEGKHQRHILGISVNAPTEAVGVVAIGSIVVRVDVNDIVTGVVVEVVLGAHGEGIGSVAEAPVHGEVDDRQARVLRIVLGAVIVAVEPGVVGAEEVVVTAIVLALSEYRLSVGRRAIFALHDHAVIPLGGVVAPCIVFVLLPGVETWRAVVVVTAIDDLLGACTHLGVHEEGSTATLVFVLLGGSAQAGDECLVEGESRYVTAGVDAEAVDAHGDELGVAVDDVVVDCGVLGVEVDAVAGDLTPPARGVVPAPVVTHVVPVVVAVVVDTVDIFHQRQAGAILLTGGEAEVVGGQLGVGVKQHRGVDVAQILGVVLDKHGAEVLLAEVAGVLEHNVKDNLHAAGMCGINEVLELAVVALVARVDLAEVKGVIAVVVETGGILDDGGNPHCGEAQRLDVVQFLDKSFEVATPLGVVDVLDTVPAIGVVAVVTVVETRGDGKIDSFIAEVGTISHKSYC